CMQALDYPLSF
nr:immunoglobulin light chain junction region [Macaca mulatta]